MRLIGLDVGEKRIGVARADSSTRIAVPIGFINVDGTEWQGIERLARINNTNFFVIGLPRSNEGKETKQSIYVRNFAKTLIQKIPEARIKLQDESLTSVIAEERLKSRRRVYEKGEIDAEAAAIILQDFLESFVHQGELDLPPETTLDINPQPNKKKETTKPPVTTIKETAIEAREAASNLAKKETDKMKLNTRKAKQKMKKTAGIITFAIAGLLIVAAIGGVIWGKEMLTPMVKDCTTGECQDMEFVVSEGETKSIIADNLEDAGLIKSAFVFKTYQKLFKSDIGFKSGKYFLNKGQSVDEIMAILEQGPSDDKVFVFTILPGETIFDVKDNMRKVGFLDEEIEEAFAANYDFDFLRQRPEGATLEGYLFGETYEFYKDTSAKELIETFLKGTADIIAENNLESAYAAQGLTLHEGITLASIIQKESNTPDMPTVAQVFLTRLNEGISLGSDVTVSYALDVADPDREMYTDNAMALEIDSCYNTRQNPGLPCGPISNPGLDALNSVASPSDTSYLYFLTGDDGLMYYSYTEDEHLQNARDHCQALCNVSL